MTKIITVNPDDVLANSDARVFFIVYTCNQGTFMGLPGGTIQNAEHGGFGGSPAISRERLIEDYARVLSNIRGGGFLSDGRLDIIPLPTFESN